MVGGPNLGAERKLTAINYLSGMDESMLQAELLAAIESATQTGKMNSGEDYDEVGFKTISADQAVFNVMEVLRKHNLIPYPHEPVRPD